ncbi:hypothetical protein DL96DRAFT_1020999 [Flagelloscypha sp. PMI_526]|nr:hypothetical protein DL96DRAFT_1020999 [Flagelloscypha sp. PMI_526]
MEANRDLPLDVLQLLFEFSASASFESAKALSLVSKDVQLWSVTSCAHIGAHSFTVPSFCRTDPYIFKFVQGYCDDYSEASRTCLLRQLYVSTASPRIALARNHVRTISWKGFVPKMSYIEQALEYLPNIIYVYLWANLFPFFRQHDDPKKSPRFEIIRYYPSLRRVATSIDFQSTVPPNAFGSPFWIAITHLQLSIYTAVSSSESSFRRPLFATMPSLTHLAIAYTTGTSEPDTDFALSRVKETFPTSLRLCLLAFVAPEDVDRSHWLAEMVSASRKIDERIVMWYFLPEDDTDEIVVTNGGVTFETWCKYREELRTHWEAGEIVVKRRREQICAG